MLPVIYIGDYPLATYYVMVFLALLAVFVPGIHWNYRYGPKLAIGPGIIFWAGVPGFLLGRILYFALFVCPGDWKNLLDFGYGGTMFLGVLLGCLGGVMAYCRVRELPVLRTLDVFVPWVPLGGICGRVGCLLYGCCYGRPAMVPWAIRFPADSPAWAEHVQSGWCSVTAEVSLPVHPSQVYAILAWLVIFAGLVILRRRNPPSGAMLAGLVGGYFAKRFLLDFFRADYPPLVGPLDLMQTLALGVVPVCAAILWFALRHHAASETSASQE
ncbi:MAG TPA: prolipoprotein diacylglyceryl transferase [Candidatus Hydrogenedentes bacterium]|nr:prolipoprotein diacylglyceryl transferase [Candidatus Hydrogenedentota bacterium]